jgi:hypothetical protein
MLRSQENAPILFKPGAWTRFAAEPAGLRRWEELIAAAYQFGFPLFEQARVIYQFSYSPQNPNRRPVNTFIHARKLTGFNEQKITTPNNDTIYSTAAIDLSAGPVQLDVPSFASRYYSVSFFDAYTNVFACVGTRLYGGEARRFLLVGPGWSGQANSGETIIRSPGNHIVALARIQANGPQEYDEVHLLQDSLVLRALTIPMPRRLVAPDSQDPLNFVSVVNQVLRENPAPQIGCAVQENLAYVGIGPDVTSLSEKQKDMWYQFFGAAKTRLLDLSEGFGRKVNGWEYLPFNTASFGEDYEARAVIALKGFWANIPAEQIYTFAVADHENAALTGRHRYRLLLPRERAQDGLFWSLSIYERNGFGQLFFRDNPLHRYAIGSNTSGLVRRADGSVEVFIQEDLPCEGAVNWLPAPPEEFAMVMRVYLPKDPAIGTTACYPAVMRV